MPPKQAHTSSSASRGAGSKKTPSAAARATAPPAQIPGEKIKAIFDDEPSGILKVPEPTPSKARGVLMRATTPHPNVIGFVLSKYRLEGWEVIMAPATAPMDLICVRATRFHFVKVLGGAEPTDGERNQFIQNAMSNTAEPVFATVEGEKMTLKNINEGTRVVIKSKVGQK